MRIIFKNFQGSFKQNQTINHFWATKLLSEPLLIGYATLSMSGHLKFLSDGGFTVPFRWWVVFLTDGG